MKMHVLAIRDIKADVFLTPPMFVANIGSAIRDFGDACRGEPAGNQIAKHPEDYELYHTGVWDDKTATVDNTEGPDGKVNTTDKPIQIAVGSNYSK